MTAALRLVDGQTTLSKSEAESLDKEIRQAFETVRNHFASLRALVEEAKSGRAWEVLGFKSWPAYAADVFTVDWRIDRAERRELVEFLRGEGMSQRVIADVVGAAPATLHEDLAESTARNRPVVTGRDGRVYKPKPKPEPTPNLPASPFCDRGDDFPEALKILKTVYKNVTFDLNLDQIEQVEDFLERNIKALQRRKKEIEK